MNEQTTTLFFTSGNSDKEYRVELREKDALWNVTAYNGKRGKANTARPQTPEPVAYTDALKIFNAAVAKKTKEGYVQDTSGTSELTDEVQRKKRVAAIQKFIPEEGFFDGWRCPDDANVVTWGGDRAELTETIIGMDGGVCVSSVLLVPSNRASDLFQAATDNITAMGKQLKKDNCFENDQEVALIALWEVPNTHYALLGMIATLQEDLEGALNLEGCVPLAFSGNDNCTETFLYELDNSFEDIVHKDDVLNVIASLVAANHGIPFEKVWQNWVTNVQYDYRESISDVIVQYVNEVCVASESKKTLTAATNGLGADTTKKAKM